MQLKYVACKWFIQLCYIYNFNYENIYLWRMSIANAIKKEKNGDDGNRGFLMTWHS